MKKRKPNCVVLILLGLWGLGVLFAMAAGWIKQDIGFVSLGLCGLCLLAELHL